MNIVLDLNISEVCVCVCVCVWGGGGGGGGGKEREIGCGHPTVKLNFRVVYVMNSC